MWNKPRYDSFANSFVVLNITLTELNLTGQSQLTGKMLTRLRYPTPFEPNLIKKSLVYIIDNGVPVCCGSIANYQAVILPEDCSNAESVYLQHVTDNQPPTPYKLSDINDVAHLRILIVKVSIFTQCKQNSYSQETVSLNQRKISLIYGEKKFLWIEENFVNLKKCILM